MDESRSKHGSSENTTRRRRALDRLKTAAYSSPVVMSVAGPAAAQGPGDPLGGIDVSAVPVLPPSGVALLGSGLAAAGVYALRKRRHSKDDDPSEP